VAFGQPSQAVVLRVGNSNRHGCHIGFSASLFLFVSKTLPGSRWRPAGTEVRPDGNP
jgi:hypothetical protein